MKVLRRVAAAAAFVVAVSTLAGCGTAADVVGPRFVLSENPSPVWEPVGIQLVSLPPGERVAVRARVRASAVWSSQAVYAVPPDGVVDLARDVPVEAPFVGADGMGLFWSLRNAAGTSATSGETWGGATVTVALDATVGGRQVAATRVQRIGLAAAAPARAVFADGFAGDYFPPVTSSEALRPGVIVFDGTDLGASTGVLAAATLSAMGYPAFALSTFSSRSEADPPHSFPAERFLAALNWLRTQPGVDDQRIFTFGASRGAQLALWAATAYPGEVYGAIAPAGTTGLVCSSPVPGPAVTVGGDWVPCATRTYDVRSSSVLDIERIPGPVVLGCAGKDEQLDNGCAWLDEAAAKRPAREGDTYLVAPDATHDFTLPPYTPLSLPPPPAAQPTERARQALWSAIAAALSAPSSVPGR